MRNDQPDRPLHEQAPTTRFSDRVQDYVKFRPGYPAAAFDAIIDGFDSPSSADIGAGTGISTAMLAERCRVVYAVEPNPDMAAGSTIVGRDVRWVAGTAESTTLADSCVDIVLAAQAFHWFRPRESLAEFARVLCPHGRLALLWNIRDESDPVSGGYTQAIRTWTGNHPAEMRGFDPTSVTSSGFFGGVCEQVFRNTQTLDLPGFLGRARSASYVPKSGQGYERLMQALAELHATHADAQGLVTMRYHARLFTYSKS